MNFKDLAAQVLMDNIDGAHNYDNAVEALDRLAGRKKSFELGEMVSKFQRSGGDLANKARSWLGDGNNESISASTVNDVIGSDKVAAFARTLGIDHEEASQKLAKLLPQIIDRSSQRGRLINSIGGESRLARFTSMLLKKSA